MHVKRFTALLWLLGVVVARIYDDDKVIQETYDDSWMNTILPSSTGYQVPASIKVRPLLFSENLQDDQQTCPSSHPNVYYNGEYCCEYNQEKVYKPQGEQCDGGTMEFTSLCCKDNAYIRCTEPPCSNFLPTGNVHSLEKVLVPGDKINVWGTYQLHSSKFSVNLKNAHGARARYLIHVDFRPEKNVTVLNSRLARGWGREIRCDFPAFTEGEQFKITLLCEASEFRIYVNDEELPVTFPYRANLSTANVVSLEGGSSGLSWDKVELPSEPFPKDFDAALEKLYNQVEEQVRGRTASQVNDYLITEESLAVFQWQLLTYIKEQGHTLDLNDETIRWILHTPDALEKVLTSGDVQNNRWKEAVEIIAQIIRQDQHAKVGVKSNLAVAIGLTFSTNVHSMAHGGQIDGIARYHNYARWADELVLFEPFYKLNAWQMRYVVGSWAEDVELEWARVNVLESHRSPDKIADVTHSMVDYNLYNADGVSVHNSGYYYYKPITLAWIHAIGGVCGSISKFGAGMAQAFGIPALPVGQPGHCAYIWLKNGETWTLGNDISGWAASTTHSGILYTWKIQAPFFPIMNEAQLNPTKYRLSEKMRIVSESFSDPGDRFEILEHATTVCPQNYDAWIDMEHAISQPSLDRNVIESALVPTLVKYKEERAKPKNIALEKNVTANTDQDGAKNIVAGSSSDTWYSKPTTAWVEIDLGNPCTVQELRIHWWGQSKSGDYDLLAEVGGNFVVVRTETDEQLNSWFNGWSTLQGWAEKTTRIRLNMRNGALDPWYFKYYFGIRQIVITGIEHGKHEIVSALKPTTTNVPGRGAELVDGSSSPIWTSNSATSTIDIDLKSLCLMSNVTLSWVNGIQGQQTVRYLVGGETTNEANGPYRNIELNGVASRLHITLESSDSYSLSEVTAVGASYTARDVLKMKIAIAFDADPYMKKVLNVLVGVFRCELCENDV